MDMHTVGAILVALPFILVIGFMIKEIGLFPTLGMVFLSIAGTTAIYVGCSLLAS